MALLLAHVAGEGDGRRRGTVAVVDGLGGHRGKAVVDVEVSVPVWRFLGVELGRH